MSNRLYRIVPLDDLHWTIELAWKRFFGLTTSDWNPTHELCMSEADAIYRAMDYISLWGGEIVTR